MGVSAKLARAAALPSSIPDERLVYLALRNLIKGDDARIRRAKKVRNFISKQQDHAEIKRLIQKHTLDNLCETAKKLLQDRIFESSLQARLRFPDVFKDAENKKAKRPVIKKATAKDEVTNTQRPVDARRTNAKTPMDTGTENKTAVVNNQAEQHQKPAKVPLGLITKGVPAVQPPFQTCQMEVKSAVDADTNGDPDQPAQPINPLYPISLPFAIQHRLLLKLQHILEHSCYAFAQTHHLDILKASNWGCPEAVELTQWAKFLVQYPQKLCLNTSATGKSLTALCKSLAEIRHAAVHRVQLDATATQDLIVDAEALIKLFDDDDALNTVCKMRQHVQKAVEEMERKKNMLGVRMGALKNESARMRAESERREREVWEMMIREDEEYARDVGVRLEEGLGGLGVRYRGSARGESEDEAEGKENQGAKKNGSWTLWRGHK